MTTSNTPLKLGIVVGGDIDFFGSTGHDFLIGFAVVGVIIGVKIVDIGVGWFDN
jgi:hypothetical protein